MENIAAKSVKWSEGGIAEPWRGSGLLVGVGAMAMHDWINDMVLVIRSGQGSGVVAECAKG